MFGVWDRIFVHIIWSTWDRLPLVENEEVKRAVYACIAAKCSQLRCRALAVGGVQDHVHLLSKLHRTVALAELVGEVKGSSSHMANHKYRLETPLRWQRGYAALSVSPHLVEKVRVYIQNQSKHHANGTELPALEQLSPESDQHE